MITIFNLIVGIVALQHLAFLALEMFFWTKPLGLKVFRQTLEQAQSSKVLAQNQGLYNGFLSAGLIWGLFYPQAEIGFYIKLFFLCCVAVAGVFGAFTVNKRIFFIQALPALIAVIIFILTIHK